ncbi:arginine--tRNA ligase [Tengunoibacter tsumagoiensis]|uniref:arginine--tRNA ligase n=1 Tax=Tengunoibacter tsumagoiensis TaxID=2014871 RepID=A0A402A0N9_9CHLR|nr:arginine--tRNA ligase [Tengunoibacter tsumagoiensis]GCE12645.1 arginine--tRNA ligase [Tengunoibacter tsumagoiensis]
MSVTNEAHHMAEATPKDLYEYLTEIIHQAVVTYLAQEEIAFDVAQLPIDLRISAQASFGDYSIPVMAWSGKLKRPPLKIAESLQAILSSFQLPTIQEITATKPGFLNIRLNRAGLGKRIVERILESGPDFGQNTIGIGTKVIVEHTNINSNKAAHVGHLRNSCLGDTIVRMLRAQGYQVETNNYIDDSGVQVADVVAGFTLLQQGLLQLPDGNEQLPGESFDYFCSRVYVGVAKLKEEKTSEAGQLAQTLSNEVLHAIEHGDESASGPDYALLASDLSHQIVQAHLKTMSRLNIFYDLLPWESAMLHAGLWKKTFELLKSRGLLEQPESGPAAGCWILPFGDGESQTKDGDRTSDKILVKSNGVTTYTAKDIAYQLWKFGLSDDLDVQLQFVPWGIQHDGRKLWTMRTPKVSDTVTEEAPSSRFGHAKRVINVIDVRQSYLQQVVYESLRRLGHTEQADNSKHLSYEVVTLSAATAARLGVDTSDGREYYAMSGRKGIEIKADDLIDAAIERMREVRQQDNKAALSDESTAALAASAIRYFMIRFNLQQIITLDMDEVLRPNGDTGVYLQYAYARANSILRRLQEAGYEVSSRLDQLPTELEQSEWELLRHLDVYPRRLAEATEQLSPASLATYIYDLAAHFSDFYEHTTPILKETNEQVKSFRAALVQATAQTMNNALRVLGFEPLERI